MLGKEMDFTILKTLVDRLIKIRVSPVSFLVKSNKDRLWLRHFRVGHPSFRVLKLMFHSLFKGLDIRNSHCDVCELAKHRRVLFSLTNNRSSLPFTLIHSDIWCPSLVPNILGARVSVGALDLIRLGILYTDNCNHIYY